MEILRQNPNTHFIPKVINGVTPSILLPGVDIHHDGAYTLNANEHVRIHCSPRDKKILSTYLPPEITSFVLALSQLGRTANLSKGSSSLTLGPDRLGTALGCTRDFALQIAEQYAHAYTTDILQGDTSETPAYYEFTGPYEGLPFAA